MFVWGLPLKAYLWLKKSTSVLWVYLYFPSIHNFSLGPGEEKAEVVWERVESPIGVFQEDKWSPGI